MIEQSNATPTTWELEAEAIRLIRQVARRPGSKKLLLGLLPILKASADYKINRQRPRKI